MSRSEHDLRRALHHGEEDAGIDPGRIIAAGEARRAQRRVRVRAGVVAGALVAVVATGGVLSTSGNDEQAGSASAGGDAASRPSTAAAGGRTAPAPTLGRGGSGASGGAASTAGCPATFPRVALPGGGSPGQFGSGGALFAHLPAEARVCSYSSGGTPTGAVALGAALAGRLAASMENAPKQHPTCTQQQDLGRRDYVVLASAADGTALRAVTVSLGRPACQNQVTNGTAVRYGWRPPAGLDGVFTRLGTNTPSGRLTGSPVRS